MRTAARFPAVGDDRGHYESFYIKATRPGGGRAVWLRHTVHKRPGHQLRGSVWLTLFDRESPSPRAAKVTVDADGVSAPAGAYIEVAGCRMEPGRARGELAAGDLEAAWELKFDSEAPAFHHLPYEFLYRAPLPKTKFRSPYPDARFSGTLTVDGEALELDAWPGMVGHNWGGEHAERWTWIQANDFAAADACFDAAIGRIKVGPLTTPWVGNGILRLDGAEHRLGGFDRIRSTRIDERPSECAFELSGSKVKVRGRVSAEPRNFVAWIYADPKGAEHNTLNCSISDLELTVEREGEAPRALRCAGAAAYELGVRETDHGIPLQPYPDG